MAGHRVLISGTSGLALTYVLRQLKKRAVPAPQCCKAEKHFLQAVQDSPLASDLSFLPPELAMIKALQSPREVLVRCWREAFERLADEGFPDIDSENNATATDTGKDIVLAAHMCYYHQQTREFVSLINLDVLKDRFVPKMIVTLVDDVEHIFARLRQKGHMLSHYDYHGFGGFVQACKNLSQLVHWRASELAFAETFARCIGCDHYVLALKHPVDTLGGLLFDHERPRAYLSHPITEPRRSLKAGDRETFDAFCEELELAAARLRAHVTLFEPTAIDEFRFESLELPTPEEGKRDTVYLPSLSVRWPIPAPGEDLAWCPVSDENPVDLYEYFTAQQLDDFRAAKTVVAKARAPVANPANPEEVAKAETRLAALVELGNATHLVGSLVGDIGRAVTARDLKLVQQSDHLVVVRPLFHRRASGGVREEIRQHCQLMAARGDNRGGIWVFTSQSDEEEWSREQLAPWLHRDRLEHQGVSQAAIREAVAEIPVSAGSLASDSASLLEDLRARIGDLLDALVQCVRQEFGVELVPRRADPADDRPLKRTAEVQRAGALQKLAEDLLETLTPPYLEWPLRFGQALDISIPVSIYWGNPWPRPQDLVVACRAMRDWNRRRSQ